MKYTKCTIALVASSFRFNDFHTLLGGFGERFSRYFLLMFGLVNTYHLWYVK